jgi:hypothetical protein
VRQNYNWHGHMEVYLSMSGETIHICVRDLSKWELVSAEPLCGCKRVPGRLAYNGMVCEEGDTKITEWRCRTCGNVTLDIDRLVMVWL